MMLKGGPKTCLSAIHGKRRREARVAIEAELDVASEVVLDGGGSLGAANAEGGHRGGHELHLAERAARGHHRPTHVLYQTSTSRRNRTGVLGDSPRRRGESSRPSSRVVGEDLGSSIRDRDEVAGIGANLASRREKRGHIIPPC